MSFDPRVTLAVVSVTLMLASGASAQDCSRLYDEQAGQIQSIDLNTFDRTQGKGWRVLADAACFAQAERLILDFNAAHGSQPSLYVHLGQMQLRQEKRADAARNFKLAVRSDRADSEFRYNDFVLALAAYAERDRSAFDAHLAAVRQFPENFGNKMNLRLLDQVSAHFDEDYLKVLAAHAAKRAP